jgi:transcriptional regulator with XRE-family HTH domain
MAAKEDFGFEANSGRTYVSEVERGKRNATVTVVEKFAKVLGVTPGYLLDADPRKKG